MEIRQIQGLVRPHSYAYWQRLRLILSLQSRQMGEGCVCCRAEGRRGPFSFLWLVGGGQALSSLIMLRGDSQ